MTEGLFVLADQLRGLNDALHGRRRERPHRDKLRAGLETHVGVLQRAQKLDEARIRDLFGGRPLVGVDGSLHPVGGNYPYTIQLFRALAKSTLPDREQRTTVSDVRLFSPLCDEDYRRLRQFTEEHRASIRIEPQEDARLEHDLAEQQAYHMLIDQQMVEMELLAAIEAMQRFDPFLLLMDGGFSRLKGKGGEHWDAFEATALDRGTRVVGVIEEVGSYRLQSRLGSDLLDGLLQQHDREILFGTLDEGEWLKTSLDRPIKNEFYTVFTRLSEQPQAGALDFLRLQAEAVDDIVDFLYTITPPKSRGIPLWLDLVDAEARLTRKQVELLVKTHLDPENIESYLRPQRERRDF